MTRTGTWLSMAWLLVACPEPPTASVPTRSATPPAYDAPVAAGVAIAAATGPSEAAEARVYAEALAAIAQEVETAIAQAQREPPTDAAAAREVLRRSLPQTHLPQIGLALERAKMSTEQLRAWMEANPDSVARSGADLEARLARQEPALRRVLEHVVTLLPPEDPTAARMLDELRRRGKLQPSVLGDEP
jgi:hypothetical protein